jgi:EF-hand domain
MQAKDTPIYVMPSPAQIEMAFDAFDSDKGGLISARELQQILSRCGVIADLEHCEALVEVYGEKKETKSSKNDNKKKVVELELGLVGFNNMIKDLFTLVSANDDLKRSQTVLKTN